MEKQKVLFLCIHNSGRSQIAEAYLKKFGGENFEVESAGLEPGVLNPLVVEVLKEEGIDISANQTKSVFDLFQQGKRYHYVISVCDAAAAERCPIFPGAIERLNWSFADPAGFTGSQEEKLAEVRKVRDQIKIAVNNFLSEKG